MGWFAFVDLLVLNVFTIVTEFIGVALAMEYFGVDRRVGVAVAVLALAGVTLSGSLRRWERAMFALVACTLLAVPIALLAGMRSSDVADRAATTSPPLGGGIVVFVVAMAGTTVAPWQLFLHQSYVVDKRITPRWLGYERVDTLLGTALFSLGAIAVLMTGAFVFSGTPPGGGFVDAGGFADTLGNTVGRGVGAAFAVLLLAGSLLGAGAVSLATSYAAGDVFGTRHSLHRPWRDAPVFHAVFVATITAAAAVALVPRAPLGIVTAGVQVLAGVLLPSATVFLLLLCNDRAVLGPWVNTRWLNAVSAAVVAVLVFLSALLTASTLLDDIGGHGGVAIASVLAAAAIGAVVGSRQHSVRPEMTSDERRRWTMPRLESLDPPGRSRARAVGLAVLRGYLVVAAVFVIVKVVAAITV